MRRYVVRGSSGGGEGRAVVASTEVEAGGRLIRKTRQVERRMRLREMIRGQAWPGEVLRSEGLQDGPPRAVRAGSVQDVNADWARRTG
jgi:hypothetical protein